jgi:heptosyltransferase-2
LYKTRNLIGFFKKLIVQFLINAQNVANISLEKSTQGRILKDPNNIDSEVLIVRTQAVGDFLMSLPAIKAIADAFPHSKILFLALGSTASANSAKVKAYLKGGFIWREVIPKSISEHAAVYFPSLKTIFADRTHFKPLFKNIKRCYLVGENISYSFGITKKIILLRLLGFRGKIYGVKVRACLEIFPEHQICEGKIEHHVLTMLRTVSECPIVAKYAARNPDLSITINQEVENKAVDLLVKKLFISGRYAVISPGSIFEFKRWPEENFVDVARTIIDQYDLDLIITGSDLDAKLCSRIYDALAQNKTSRHRVLNLCGQTSVVTLAAILKSSKFLIANDGGACHIAASVGCPVISIANGAEPINSVEPWGFQHLTARCVTECSPCYSFTKCPLGTKACVNGVTVGLVLSKIPWAIRYNEKVVDNNN